MGLRKSWCRTEKQCEACMVEEVHTGKPVQCRCGLCHPDEPTDLGCFRTSGRFFTDPLMDCKECHERFRADKLIEDFCTGE